MFEHGPEGTASTEAPEIPESPDQVPAVDTSSPEPSTISKPNFLHGESANAYFEPRKFETEELYRALGVGFFKKIVPTGGDYASRLIRKRNPDFSSMPPINPNIDRTSRLLEYEHATRAIEAGHLGFIAVIGAIQTEMGVYSQGWPGAIIGGLVQITANVYPIMLQRFNRIRVRRVLARIASGGPSSLS